MAQNGLTLLLAFAGGVFNGTFPVFIKTPRVLAARVHPVVFQLYKSTMVRILMLGPLLQMSAVAVTLGLTAVPRCRRPSAGRLDLAGGRASTLSRRRNPSQPHLHTVRAPPPPHLRPPS